MARPARTVSEHEYIAQVGEKVRWSEINVIIIEASEKKELPLPEDYARKAKILFISEYTVTPLRHAAAKVRDSISYRRFCGYAIGDETPDDVAMEEYYNQLRTIGAYKAVADTFARCVSYEDPEFDYVNDRYGSFIVAMSLSEVLYRLMDGADTVKYDVKLKMFDMIHGDKKKLKTHPLQLVHLVVTYEEPQNYKRAIDDISRNYADFAHGRHTEQEFAHLKKCETDIQVKKYYEILEYWAKYGTATGAIQTYKEVHKMAEDPRDLVYDTISIYLHAGFQGLYNFTNSREAIRNGLPVNWRDYYSGVISLRGDSFDAVVSDLRNIADENESLRSRIESIIKRLNILSVIPYEAVPSIGSHF